MFRTNSDSVNCCQSDKIFGRDGTGGDIRACLVSHAPDERTKREASDIICDEFGDAFRAWDTVFKAIHEDYHSEDHSMRFSR